MRRLVSDAAASRELDRRLIHDVGVPGLSLMEVAGRGVAEVVARVATGRRVAVLAGSGNNGGDGYVAARWLHAWGVPTVVHRASAPSTADARATARAAERAGVPIAPPGGDLPEADVYVDALLGTGATRPPTGVMARWLTALAGRRVVAVDLPTGLDADTGAVAGVAVTAAETVTFGRYKPGMFAGEGRFRCGVVHRVDLGQEGVDPSGTLAVGELGDADAPPVRPPVRPASAHKRTSGHLLVVAGTARMAGAAVLACRGALAGGVGLVTLWAPVDALPRLGALPPEVMLVFEPPDPSRFGAVAAGPGLGRPVEPERLAWLTAAWGDPTRAVVFDADALPLAGASAVGQRVVTPHAAEAGRILGLGADAVEADRFRAAAALATGRVAVLKGPDTLIAAPGRPTWVNPTGNAGLATGGTGDVLTGLVGALLARGLPAFDAARLAVWAHGRAADDLASQGIPEPVASDLPAAIARILARYR